MRLVLCFYIRILQYLGKAILLMNKPTDRNLNRQALERVARVFSAFSDATRLAILQELKAGELPVGALVDAVGVSQGNVSKQLQLLFDAGLLTRRKQGTQVFYTISEEIVLPMCELVCGKLNRDAQATHSALTFQI